MAMEQISRETMERIARGERAPEPYEGALTKEKAQELLRRSPKADYYIPIIRRNKHGK